MPREWHICFSPFRAVGQAPKRAHSKRHRLAATLDSLLQLFLCLRCLLPFLFLLPFVLIVVVVVVVVAFFVLFCFFGGDFQAVFCGVCFFFCFSFFNYFLILCSFCYFFVAFILFLYFIYNSWLIQSSFQFQGLKRAISQGIRKVSLLEEDDCCFPSRCGTGVFVCSPVLDIMLAFQDDGGFTVHGFPIHSWSLDSVDPY